MGHSKLRFESKFTVEKTLSKDYTKVINREGLEYNFRLGITTSTSDYPPETQYPYLNSAYLITGRTPLDHSHKSKNT